MYVILIVMRIVISIFRYIVTLRLAFRHTFICACVCVFVVAGVGVCVFVFAFVSYLVCLCIGMLKVILYMCLHVYL